MERRWGLLLLSALGLVPSRSEAQQGLDTATINIVRVTERVHMLTGPGGNIGVSSGPDGIFLIDDQYAPVTAKIRAALATIGGGAIRFVLNTHWHGDHTGGNENLGQSGTIIVAQDNVRTRMSSDQLMEFLSMKEKIPASPKAALPVVTFGETITFYLNDEEIHAFHVAPAHTDGDAVIHFRRGNVVHTGDIYFNGLYPFIDVSSGGSLDGMIAAATRILAIANDSTRIIPGHGPLARRGDLLAYREMLTAVRDRVRASISRGRTLAQTVAEKPTAEFDAAWGQGFLTPDDFVGMVYNSLARNGGR